MLGRLLVGMMKGIVLGGLLGFGLYKLGMAVPSAIVAYLAAATVGVLIGLIAGKPIWAKDAKIEAGMKAFVGALLGAGLMFAARRWLAFPVPQFLLDLTHTTVQSGAAAPTISEFAMTSLAAIAGVLGGFYDADNTPEDDKPAAKGDKAPATKARIAKPPEDEEVEDDIAEEPEKKKSKK
jgi:hypothetical protein